MDKFLHIKDNFIDVNTCSYLIELHKNAELETKRFHPVDAGELEILPFLPKTDETVDKVVNQKIDYVKNSIGKDLEIYNVEIVKWKPDMFMAPHFDITKTKIKYKVATVLYLNDEYFGGNTYIKDDVQIKPITGRCIFFDGLGYEHGVSKVFDKDRYTLISWFV